MNRNLVIALIFLAIGGLIISNIVNDQSTYSTYGSFDTAKASEKIKIKGLLAKDLPMEYDPENKPNEFIFHMTDDKGITKKVILNQPKPQDFEMSEEIVVTGKMKGDEFLATEILMKCPSKYKDEEISIKNQG